jgi:hypothetical protein
MLNWLRRRTPAPTPVPSQTADVRPVAHGGVRGDAHPDVRPEPAKRSGRIGSNPYVLLYKYLDGRYADTVVLTFAQIEDLLGFKLPDQARVRAQWWADGENAAGSGYSDAWVLASRTAVPNLSAKVVVFDRAVG